MAQEGKTGKLSLNRYKETCVKGFPEVPIFNMAELYQPQLIIVSRTGLPDITITRTKLGNYDV